MRFIQISVLRNETATISSYVAPWEVPVLEAVHSKERLTVGEAKDFSNRKWPTDAESEMHRMASLYGKRGSGDDALSYAERVYGEGSRGVEALAKAMTEAREAAEAEPVRKPKRKPAEDLLGGDKTASA